MIFANTHPGRAFFTPSFRGKINTYILGSDVQRPVNITIINLFSC
jgi:hypothetical protein